MIEALHITGPRRTLFLRKYREDFDLSILQQVKASQHTEVHYLDSVVVCKKIGELSVFVCGPQDFSELYLEHCMECVISSVCSQLIELTEECVLENLLTFNTAVSETIDDGFLLTNRTFELFDQEKKEGGLLGGLKNGAKLVAKTLLS